MTADVDEGEIIEWVQDNIVPLMNVLPGDRITFGDHTGSYRVWSVETGQDHTTIRAWFRRRRTERNVTPVWRWR